MGNLVQGNRLASAQGRDMGYSDDSDAARKVKTYIILNFSMLIKK